jgi:chromosome segregation ATPase
MAIEDEQKQEIRSLHDALEELTQELYVWKWQGQANDVANDQANKKEEDGRKGQKEELGKDHDELGRYKKEIGDFKKQLPQDQEQLLAAPAAEPSTALDLDTLALEQKHAEMQVMILKYGETSVETITCLENDKKALEQENVELLEELQAMQQSYSNLIALQQLLEVEKASLEEELAREQSARQALEQKLADFEDQMAKEEQQLLPFDNLALELGKIASAQQNARRHEELQVAEELQVEKRAADSLHEELLMLQERFQEVGAASQLRSSRSSPCQPLLNHQEASETTMLVRPSCLCTTVLGNAFVGVCAFVCAFVCVFVCVFFCICACACACA